MSNIKINDVYQRVQYSAALNQTIFTVPYPFFQNNYLFVWVNGIELNQGAAPGQYLVAGAGSPSGGTVTLVTPSINGDIVTIEGKMPIDRTSIYSATISNLTGSDLNGDFNREVVMMKQLETVQDLLQVQYAPWALVSQDQTVTKDRYIPILPPLGAWRKNALDTQMEYFLTPDAPGIAPSDALYLIQTANANLPDAIALDEEATGFMVNVAGTGFAATRIFQSVANQLVIDDPDGMGGNPLFGIADNAILPGTAGMGIPAGTIAERVTPTPPSIGFRFNTDLGQLEAYIGGNWVAIPSEAAGLFLPLVGGTMSGVIDMDGNTIANVPNPVSNLQVANKIYVDNLIGNSAGGVTSNMQYNDGGSFAGDPNFNTDGSGNIGITGSLAVDNLLFNGNLISPSTGVLQLQSPQLTTALNANSHLINNLSTPIAGTDAATKDYVDQTALNGTSVYAATTANLTVTQAGAGVGATLTNAGAQAVFALDGVSPPLGSLILVKNLANAANEGIYSVTNVGSLSTNWVLTRATSYDTAVEINNTGLIVVRNGSTLAGTAWYNSATIVTVDTTNFSYASYGLTLPLSVSNGGTGRSTLDVYRLLAGGTTNTGVVQSVNPGNNGQLLQSKGNAALPDFTTATYPTTTTINQILYSSAANTIVGLATTNSSVLVTSAGGVPSLSTTLPASLTIPTPLITGLTGGSGPASGNVGEVVVAAQNANVTSLTSATYLTINQITLGAGNWVLFANMFMSFTATTITQCIGILSNASNSNTTLSGGSSATQNIMSYGGAASANFSVPMRPYYLSITGTTTVYLNFTASFTGSASSVNQLASAFAVRIS